MVWGRRERTVALVLGVLGSAGWGAVAPTAAGAGALKLLWAFGAVTGKPPALVSVTKDRELQSGDEIKLMVELKQAGYVYVFHRDSTGTVQLLFPYSVQALGVPVELNHPYYIPEGEKPARLDDRPGQERIYVLASVTRLEELEALLRQHATAAAERRAELAEAIVSEVQRLRRTRTAQPEPAERPVPIAGVMRGPPWPEIATFATEIVTDGLYARAFTIDHR